MFYEFLNSVCGLVHHFEFHPTSSVPYTILNPTCNLEFIPLLFFYNRKLLLNYALSII